VTGAFYEPLSDGRFVATSHTRGPWDPAHQHAGPPAALLGRAFDRTEPRAEMVPARLTFEILAPIPVGEVEVETRILRPGRSVELLEGELRAGGRPVVTARAWRVLAAAAPTIGADGRPPPRPTEPTPPPPGLEDFGYGQAVEMRFAAGTWDRPGPATVWTRLRVGLVAGESPTGLERLLAVADSGNGISGVLPIDRWLYINPELTVHLRRAPRGEWICLAAETTISEGGAGLARSVLSDDAGVVAHGAQSLLARAGFRLDVAPDPLVHRDRRRRGGVDRASGAELTDREHGGGELARLGGQAGALLAEQQRAPLGELVRVDRLRAREVVDPDHREPGAAAPVAEGGERRVVADVLVAVGDHGAAAVPAAAADDVNLRREERVRVAHDRADVEVVLPVLDRDVERVAAGVEVGDDRVPPPVAVAVNDVAAVTGGEQRRIQPGVVRPRLGVGADAYLMRLVHAA
jgi:Thioesterase-like superfamily